LNYETYKLHLTLANTWNNTWQYMLDSIEQKLQKEIQRKYLNLDEKLEKTDSVANNTSTTKT
jgi:hypothetical protein